MTESTSRGGSADAEFKNLVFRGDDARTNEFGVNSNNEKRHAASFTRHESLQPWAGKKRLVSWLLQPSRRVARDL